MNHNAAPTQQARIDIEALRAKGLASSIAELPPLPENFARGIHITSPALVDAILAGGLDYSRQGMLMSTARVWDSDQAVEFTVDDPRFAGGVEIVFDLPFGEVRSHNGFTKSPGVVPPERIVGVIDPQTDPALTTQA